MVVNRPSIRATRAVAAVAVLSLLAAAVVTVDLTRTDRVAGSAPRAAAVRLAVASPPGGQDLISPQAVQSLARTTDLYACPTLRRGITDPVNGMDCVHALQAALRDNGYPEQRVTGLFFDQTKRNVQDFQRRYDLPQTGTFGPLTRDALVGPDSSPSSPSDSSSSSPPDSSSPSPPAQAIPSASPASYTGHLCSWYQRRCSLYLRRTTTHTYAQYLKNHKYSTAAAEAIAGVLTEAACIRIFRMGFLSIGCGALVNYSIAELEQALLQADAEHACLRVSVGLPALAGTLQFVGFTADNSSRCTD